MNHDEAPVVIGVGQAVNRPRQPEEAVDALELVTRAVYAAADDAGAAGGGPALLRRLDAVRVINMLSYSYPRPAATVAAAIGAPEPRVGVYTAPGGNSPQWQVNVAAERIARGEDGLTLVCGAEALESARVAAKHGITLSRGERGDVGEMAGDERSGVGPAEMALGLFAPASIYPVFENAVRARAGRGLDEHRRLLAELMARFSEVAATRPEAWFPERRTADQIYAATPSNRMVAYPYTKLMNAIIRVDQSAAVLLAPAGLARELGVPEEKWVYVWGGAEAADVWVPFERPRLDESPGIRLAAGSALAAAGVAIDDIDHFDLYSCFPVAVEMACDALGLALDDARGLTVTGGLAAFGGPGNNYVTHAIAAMVERLRERPGDKGLCTGLGWYVTKHSAGVYSTEPPPQGFRRADTGTGQAEIDASARPTPATTAEGECEVEAYTVICDQSGRPASVPLVVRRPGGERAVATAAGGPDEWEAFMEREVVGEKGRLTAGPDVSRYEAL